MRLYGGVHSGYRYLETRLDPGPFLVEVVDTAQ